MIRLVLAEKPDQAREYGKALGNAETTSGVIIVKESPYVEGEIHIVAARGHLFEYQNPKEKWALENLPLSDANLELKLKEKDDDIKRRFSIMKKEVKKADEVIIGTDADREGERIAYTILSQIEGGLSKAKKRLWIHSMTAEGIQQSFQRLKEAAETKNFYEEADARSISDWYVGMNLTQLVTLDLQNQKKVPNKKGNVVSVGRVQTPTVRLICENDRAIQQFVPTPYWKMILEEKENKIQFTSEEKILEKTLGEERCRQASTQAVVKTVRKEAKETCAPKLFNLTTLQAYGSKNWKKSADEVLKLVQTLYEKKFLTYPRTDSHFITPFEFNYLKENVQAYQNLIGISFPLANADARKQYVDDKKVKEHFAIIPTTVLPNLSELSSEERLVYETVTLRSVLMFAGNYKYESTVVKVEQEEVLFTASGKVLTDLGYKQFNGAKIKEDTILPAYQEGDILQVTPQLKEEVTKPPNRITENELLGKIFPRYQLGTPATRANIIETIQKRGYVKKDKKTGQFFPTDRGFLLIDYLKDSIFSDPKMTGGWEMMLKKVGEGQLPKEQFVAGIKEKVIEQINHVKKKP